MSDQDLRQEFEEFKETSKLYEDELENEIDAQSKLINNLQIENENLKSENIAIKVISK